MSKLANRMAYLELVKTRCEAGIYVGKHGLQAVHAYLSLANKSADVPYHNSDHILTVTKYCGRLAGMHRVPLESEKALIVAAMFHDFNHSGGTKSDTENVAEAIRAMTEFFDAHPTLLLPEEREIAIQCVECTVFPFIVEPVLEVQKIIRDADLLQSTEVDFEHILCDNLRAEISVTRGEKISRKEFAKGQAAFLNNITMYTMAGQLLMSVVKPILLQRFEAIAEGR